MTSTTFAEQLRAAMDVQGLKQVDLVQRAADRGRKLGKSQLSQYLSGKTEPRPDMLETLAELLGMPVDRLCPPAAPPTPAAATAARPTTTQKGTTMSRRSFKKSSKLENVLYDVRGPVLDAANRMEDEGAHILKLNIGNPAPFGFRTPDEVVRDMQRQLVDCQGYSSSRGLFSARKAIMQYDQLKGIANVDVDDIYTGNGASELINLCMSAFLDDGDEILIPSPDYPLWTASATLAGGKVVHYVCDEDQDWYPDMDDIRAKVTDRTKGIVIINPNNPTGALYPREVLQEIVEVARQHQLVIFSDEIYDRLVLNGQEHVSIASLAPDLFCVTFNGLSKSHMIAGYRIGWMTLSGDKSLARDYIDGINMLSNMRLCSNVPAQSIVQTCLGGHQRVKDYLVPGGRVHDQRDYVYERLSAMEGVSVVKPSAAFYIFPHLDPARFNITDDDQFALDLLREKRVLVVGGKGFNWAKPGYFRIVYLPRMHTLQEAMDALEDFLGQYRQG
ncbi:aminotransferase class I/II-fold pyridoxal phosphate-dependent enzyme [Olsenella massiliensis]|uniref:aminotransferase class I/II-fold pyridoxal phosphate-dependent enzyme n=1 Tax=Olsenella massiliensis TaxID=1622075 RepID=UPI0009EA443A|nr:aminotransferase class I/II-fold pyridoxal phosphate-dependent enzyme [Olsenella massiliensis]